MADTTKTDNDKAMDMDSLIDDLTDDLKSVKKFPHPLMGMLPYVIISVIYVAVMSYFIGLRHDLAPKSHDTMFIFEIGLVLAISVSAAFATGWLAIPDMRGQRMVLVPPILLFTVYLFWMAVQAFTDGFEIPTKIGWHHHDIDHALLMGALPVAAIVFFSRNGATTRPYMMSFMNVLFVGFIGWAGLRFTCPVDATGHTFIYHFMPFLLLGVVAGGLARRLYRW
jgi:hypothetical protein